MTRQNVFICVELIELVSEYFSMIFFSFFLKKTSQLNNTHGEIYQGYMALLSH